MDGILSIVKTLLGISDEDHDDILSLHIEIVTTQILNYCNIRELPAELRFVAAQMVVDIYRESAPDGKTGGVASVSEAGRTVSFNTALVQLTAENKLAERKTQLNRFKLVYRQ